jgi:hypothetical protein
MKKLIVLLLALLVATSAFAQLTVNGYSRGTATFAPSAGTASMLYRLRLNMTYNDASGNFGAWARLQSDGYATLALKYGYAWAKFFDGKVKVNAGQLANYDYGVFSGVSDYKLGNICTEAYIGDATDGVLVQFMPTSALNVGLTFLPSTALSGSDLTVSAKYSLDKIGNVFVNFRPADASATSSTNLFASGTFELTAVPGLDATACVEYGGNGFWHGYVAKQLTIVANVTYGQGPFSVQVAPVYNLTDSALYTEGYVQYKATKDLALRVIGAYDQSGVSLGTPGDYFVGFEASNAVGKGYIMTGAWYDKVAGLTVPVGLKVVF